MSRYFERSEDRDPDGDYDRDDDRDYDRDDEAPRMRGAGLRRVSPAADEPLMPMTRRDVDALYTHSLRDTRSFLDKRREKASGRSGASRLVQTAEVGAGAAAAGYLAQRFRTAGGPLPIGLVLGLIGHGAAYLELVGGYGDHVHNLSDGMIAGAAAIWGAGQGALGSEETNRPTTGAMVPPPQFFGAPPPAFAPVPQGAAPLTEADYQYLASQYRRGP